MRAKQGMEPCQTHLQAQRKRQSYILLARGRKGSSRLRKLKEPEEREFVVDSGAGMHMVSRKDLNSAELETVRTARNPTTVMTANGEVQTRQEATVHVEEFDLFVTVTIAAKIITVTNRKENRKQ